ncbi:MAG: polysaccharide biosynthesis C-terminal domain-containing protein, partial [Actinomycetota bacterium]|nr:polysaccharide biosynthesis C-terminal domain-containing protein [Actinomycetota bacterium]
ALFSILTTVACFGADTGFVRTVSKFKAVDRVTDLRRLLVVGFVPVVVLSAIAAAAVGLWAPQLVDALMGGGHSEAVGHLRILALFLPLASIGWVCLAIARGFGSMVPYVLIENVAKPLLRPGLAMLAVAAGLGAGAIAVSWALPVALQLPVALVLVAALLKRIERETGAADGTLPRRSSTREVAREFWGFALPRGVASVFQVSVTWLDILLVGLFLGPREAGVYAVVSRLMLAGKLTLEAIRLAIAPEMSALLARGDRAGAGRLYRVAAVWTVAPSWPFYTILFVFAPAIMSFFGPEFEAGVVALRILCVAMLFDLGTGQVTTVLLMGGKSSWNLANSLVSVTLNVTLNLILIPRIGIEGAAIAWALSILFDNVVPLVQIGILMKIRLFGRSYFQVTTAALACYGGASVVALAVFGPGAAGFAVALVAATAVYAVILYYARESLHLPQLWAAVKPGGKVSSSDGFGKPASPEPERA